jgi:hypothetical protein
VAITMCGPKCTTEHKNSFRGCGDPITSYVGRVVSLREHNGYDDSDFYALVWDDESQTVKRIMYGSTRFWTYHNSAKIDADETTQALALAYLTEQNRLADIKIAKFNASRVEVGKEVRSLTTRGKNMGVVGMVRSIGPNQYARSKWAPGVAAIEVAGEDKYRYIAVDRLEVINPDQYC